MEKDKTILVVEDEQILAFHIKQSLLKHNIKEVVCTATGKEAISLTQSLSPDLVLMDVSLKDDISGIEAAYTIRETSQVPILFMSAFTDEETTKEILEMTNTSYITKPFSMDTLLSEIQK